MHRVFASVIIALTLIILSGPAFSDAVLAQQATLDAPKDQVANPASRIVKKPQAMFVGGSYLTPAEETKLRDQLYNEADYFERQASIMKTVARLIQPTVVHIEADVTNKRSLRQGGGGQVEESGSGVIIRYNDRYFVLTNCHVVQEAPLHLIRIGLADRRSLHPERVLD